MRELFEFTKVWKEKHKLTTLEELWYLGLLLNGRLHVQVLLENLKKLPSQYEEYED